MIYVNITLKEVLSRAGYSITNARKIVFDLLLEQEPQSIHQLIIRANHSIDRASIYRTISLFETLGVAQRVYVGWKYKWELTDKFSYHHHHLSCLACGIIIPIHDDSAIKTFITKTSQQYGFNPERHQFEIYGYCQDCKSSAKVAVI